MSPGDEAAAMLEQLGIDASAGDLVMRRQTNTINYGLDLPLAHGIRFELSGGQP